MSLTFYDFYSPPLVNRSVLMDFIILLRRALLRINGQSHRRALLPNSIQAADQWHPAWEMREWPGIAPAKPVSDKAVTSDDIYACAAKRTPLRYNLPRPKAYEAVS